MELSEQLNDAALLELIRQNDSSSFRKLYEKYWKELFIKACQRVDEETAKDMVQDVMVTLWRQRATLSPGASGTLAAYLFTALRYRIITYYAYTASEIRKKELFDQPLETPEECAIEVKELKDLIEVEVCKLPFRMQQIFRMSREEDISIQEIAGQLNLSEQTVKNQLTTALKRLREQLNTRNISDYALTLTIILYYLKK